jgi:hypothetical protein
VRCLSLHQPWATFTVEGIKTIETRCWPTRYRGQLVICSTRTPWRGAWTYEMISVLADGPEGVERLGDYPRGFELGYALGVVNVVGCVPTADVYPAEGADYETTGFTGEDEETGDGGWAWAEPAGELTGHVFASRTERGLGDYSEGRWAWLLAKARRFAEPVPVRGRQRIWTPSWTEHTLIQDQIDALRSAA